MNNIAGYNNNLNGITYSENDLSKVDSVNNSNVKQDKDNKVTASTDSVQINQKNENIINTKKAYDAFNETCDQIGDLPSNFFEFCDKYKENLIKNGCK